jgi:hypothetical protein
MMTQLHNLKAFCIATLSVCLSLIVFGSAGLHAQESKPKPTDEQQRGTETDKSDQIKNQESPSNQSTPGGEINKRPLKDWLARVREENETGGFDLSHPLDVSIGLDKTPGDSSLHATILHRQGDPLAINLAEELAAALYDSGLLSVLTQKADVEHYVFDFKLDGTNVAASLSYEALSVEKAKDYARGFNAFLFIAQAARREPDEALIYKNTRVSANGKQVLFNLTISRQLAGELLTRHLSST